MAVISTKQLMNEFFESRCNSNIEKMRSQVDRQELYEYEEKIGKQLIDMNVDELFEMLATFKNNGLENAKFMVLHSSYPQISSLYRAIFDYYIQYKEIVPNPFYDLRMRGREADKRLSQNRVALTWDFVEKILLLIHSDFTPDKADYIECILRLFYNGFANVDEIVKLSEKDIDFENRTVDLRGKKICLSDRCLELLAEINSMTLLNGYHGDFVMVNWRGGYFKYPVRPKNKDGFNVRTSVEVGCILNRYISENVNKKYNTKLNYHNLFYLGFFDFIVSKVGRERANEIASSYRKLSDVKQLIGFAFDYGVIVENVTQLKRTLQPYIDNKC